MAINGPEAVSLFIAALKDEDRDARIYAAKILGNIKDPREIELLEAALKDKEWRVRMEAADALQKIRGWYWELFFIESRWI